MTIDLVLALVAGALLLFSAFSTVLQRASLPGPLLCLAFGVIIGPYALDLVSMRDLGMPPSDLLEQAARLTLGIGLAGVALRLPHGYWRRNLRWVIVIIGAGMALMLAGATAVIAWGLSIPILTALLIGAIITPTDPVVTTPIVTGSLAERKVPARVRHNLSAESGINDGLGYLFVMLPVLLLASPQTAWSELLTHVLLWEVLGGAAVGAAAGYLLGRLFIAVRRHGLMEETAYLAFILPLALLLLGGGALLGMDALLVVFVAAAVFGQVIPQRDETEEGTIHDAIARLVLLPVFVLLGLALPFGQWAELGWLAPLVIVVAVIARRMAAVWALRPLLRAEHDRAETAFLSWFAPVGVSALYYAMIAQRHTGDEQIFAYVSLAVTASVLVHGLTSAPLSAWLHRRASVPDHADGPVEPDARSR